MDKIANVMDTIESAGYAQILVKISRGSPFLAPTPTGAAAGLAAAAAPAHPLDGHFMLPKQAQPQVLAEVTASPLAAATGRPRTMAAPPKFRVFPRLGFALGFADAAGVNGLTARADVEKVLPAPRLSLIKPVARAAARKPTTVTWGIKRLKADQLWAAGFTGSGVVVGHLDTGVDGAHPALANAIDDFVEFDLQGNLVAGAAAHDSGEHGTHTAGTILGRSTDRGAFGVAPDAKLASALVIEGGDVVAQYSGRHGIDCREACSNI